MAKTGTDVTRTAIGNSILTIVVKTLLWPEALRVARISDEVLSLKAAAPVKPTIRYKMTQTIIG